MRYLTKSRFKLGLECPTKLFYTRKSKVYADQSQDDAFLQALAEGGFQVGELAKLYAPGGVDITTLDTDLALAQTYELLERENVIIYEPAIVYKNLFIRIDVLIKRGNQVQLIEVKAKSFDPQKDDGFYNKSGYISSSYKAYLYDVAFQKYVLSQAFPQFEVKSYLQMADKSAVCAVDGLNQKFRLVKNDRGHTEAIPSPTIRALDLKDEILIKINTDDVCEKIYGGQDSKEVAEKSFVELVEFLADHYERDEKIQPAISSACVSCQFKCSKEDEAKGKKSGFKECWREALDWQDQDFDEPNILDVGHAIRKAKFLNDGLIKLNEFNEDDIGADPLEGDSLNTKQRQWLQISKLQQDDKSVYFDKLGMQLEMAKWTYPLHFIDFETSMVAIPFNKGRRPYEGIAFQFSHHQVNADGSVEHKGQFLNTECGVFPNYEFIRALKKELGQDEGSIFCYSPHENTFLNLIYDQLCNEPTQLSDHEELCAFIKSITKSKKGRTEEWLGERSMVDMLVLVKKYYYDPYMGGSNSIKKVLPAVLHSSKFLQEKYSAPIYGASNGIPSLNFQDWTWLQFKGNEVCDPYKLLPKVYEDDQALERLSDDTELAGGGAALTAYARMQFTEMMQVERDELSDALLRYCELDTLAMVMIYEAWREMLN